MGPKKYVDSGRLLTHNWTESQKSRAIVPVPPALIYYMTPCDKLFSADLPGPQEVDPR